MLVLTCREGVALDLELADGRTIRILFSDLTSRKVKVAIVAPDDVFVKRSERPVIRQDA
jgi:sRNA-binding carbon storage regulator CsrA